MRLFMALLLSAVLLTACSPRQLKSAYQQRRLAEDLAKSADAMALVTVGESLPAYEAGGTIYTDVRVSVLSGKGVQGGAIITLRRHGGTIVRPDGTATSSMVDYTYRFPPKGDNVFLLLRKVGDKYEIIDAMPVRGELPTEDRPENAIYLPYLKSLR